MPPVIAVDFGGTHIRAAYYPTGTWQPVSRTKVPTLAKEGPASVISRIQSSIHSVSPADLTNLRIGIASPGPLDPRQGIVLSTSNLPGWNHVPLKAEIQSHFNLPVCIQNDANAAAVGEWKRGAGKGVNDMIYLTISTGIGGGVICGGQLLLGAGGLAGELGHLIQDPNGPFCPCGHRGHIEAMASGTAIGRIARERLKEDPDSILNQLQSEAGALSAREVGEALAVGDALACSIVEEAAHALGLFAANLVHIFNPARIVIGGGVSQMGDRLLTPMKTAMREQILHPAYLEQLEIVPAALGDDAGLIGTAVLARQL